MRALKILVIIIGALSAYRAFQVLVLGRPLDPQKALAEWVTAARAERPTGLSPGTILTTVDFRWQESNSVWFGDGLKDWTETYELREKPSEQTDVGEKERIRVHICRSELRQKVFDVGMPITARIIGPGKYDYQQLVVTKASCIGKA
jgi:hypothetical protein